MPDHCTVRFRDPVARIGVPNRKFGNRAAGGVGSFGMDILIDFALDSRLLTYFLPHLERTYHE